MVLLSSAVQWHRGVTALHVVEGLNAACCNQTTRLVFFLQVLPCIKNIPDSLAPLKKAITPSPFSWTGGPVSLYRKSISRTCKWQSWPLSARKLTAAALAAVPSLHSAYSVQYCVTWYFSEWHSNLSQEESWSSIFFFLQKHYVRILDLCLLI